MDSGLIPDLEKTKSGIEHCLSYRNGCSFGSSNMCPYAGKDRCRSVLKKDATALFETREPKDVIGIAEFDYEISVGRCPSCDRTIVNNANDPTMFCKFCGQAVKWDDKTKHC